MWDLPGPGLEPVSPASAGRLSTTAPPGKPLYIFLGKGGELTKMRFGATESLWQEKEVHGLTINNLSR